MQDSGLTAMPLVCPLACYLDVRFFGKRIGSKRVGQLKTLTGHERLEKYVPVVAAHRLPDSQETSHENIGQSDGSHWPQTSLQAPHFASSVTEPVRVISRLLTQSLTTTSPHVPQAAAVAFIPSATLPRLASHHKTKNT